MDHSLFHKHPELKEFFLLMQHEIQQAQRPADEIILDDEDVMKILKISKRTLQYMKSERTITYSQLKTRSYYRLSDILEILKQNRVQGISNELRIKN
jgi:hypothetical protein